jgi:hypothetical protein
MSKKYLCPECNGQGFLTKLPDDVDRHFRRITGPYNIRCSFCEGKGWRKLGPFDKAMCELIYHYQFKEIK